MTDTHQEFLERVTESINAEALELEMYRIHADLAYANAQYATLHGEFLRAKLGLEQTEARLYLSIREQLKVSGDKYTEKVINSLVSTHPEYETASLALISSDAVVRNAQGLARAIAAKKDMLVSIGMRVNAELKGDPLAAANSRRDREHRGFEDSP